MSGPVVELRSVTKRFGRNTVLADLDLRLEPRTSYGLLGRNACGKTTTLRLIAGMLRPTRGEVRVFGGDPFREPERVKRGVGYLAEDHEYPGLLRPADLFRFFRECYPTWDDALARSLVERFRIPVGEKLRWLSKGQKRQVALLCAVAHRPRLLVLDEPGGGLDPVVRRGFLEEVIDLLAGEATTVIFSSHNLHEVERIATRVGILHRRRIVLEDDLDALRDGAVRVSVDLDGVETTAEELARRVPGCLRARKRHDGSWRLLLFERGGVAAVAENVRERVGGRVLREEPMTLEELFIELVGEEDAR